MARTTTKRGAKKAIAKKSAKKATSGENGAADSPARKQVSAEALPRRSLEHAIEYARVLRQIFAGKAVTVDELAKAMNTTNAYSERCRSAFRGDGDRDSELMPITIPR